MSALKNLQTAPGEQDLNTLLSTLSVKLHDPTYVFVTIPATNPAPAELLTSSSAVMVFREAEGLTVITTVDVAESFGLDYVFRSKMLMLEVQSSLEAIGFMAAITKILAEKGIGCNPVSAYFHDHLFVAEGHALAALSCLQDLAVGSAQPSMPNVGKGR